MVNAVGQNDNRNTVYTAAGAGLGAIGAGAYGYTKSLLNGDAPNDAFVRRAFDNTAKDEIANAGKAAKEAFQKEANYTAAGDDVAKLKNVLKSQADKFGLKAEIDADGKETKTLDKVIEEFVDGKDAKTLKTAMEEKVAEVASDAKSLEFKSADKLIALRDGVKDLADDANAEDLKKFVTKHADALGVKADEIDGYLQKTDADGKKIAKTAKEIKDAATDAAKPLTNFTDNTLKPLVENGKLKLDNASEVIKKAAKDTKMWTGAKWAALGAAALGAATYIYTKMTDPRA